jgi:molybdate transport system permease protein
VLELSAAEMEALRLSLKVGLVSTFVSLPFAVAVAMLLARRVFPGKSLIDGIVHLPLVLPPVVVGYILLLSLGRRGPIGAWLDETFGIVIAFRWTGAAIAAGIMSFPLVVRAIRLSLEGLDRKLESAACTLGASRLWIFLTITLPLILPGVLSGAILGFARALGEFGATITFVSNIPGETRTLPIAIYSLTQVPGRESAALRLVIISILLSIVALVASELLGRQINRRLKGRGA